MLKKEDGFIVAPISWDSTSTDAANGATSPLLVAPRRRTEPVMGISIEFIESGTWSFFIFAESVMHVCGGGD